MADEFSVRYGDLLTGSYDCVDRIVLNAYMSLCHSPGGFRIWWRRWHDDRDAELDNTHLMRLAGRFSRRVRARAKSNAVPVIDCTRDERKHEIAEEYLATHPVGVGVFLVLVARSSSGTRTESNPTTSFFSTDPAAIGAEIASRYAGRWSIEVTFRDTKQDLGGENPQSWKRQGPERAACLALWLHGLTWCWYLGQHPRGDTWIPRPWYPRKASPSFLDALAALRRLLWSQRITALSAAATTAHDKTEITEALLDTLAYAA